MPKQRRPSLRILRHVLLLSKFGLPCAIALRSGQKITAYSVTQAGHCTACGADGIKMKPITANYLARSNPCVQGEVMTLTRAARSCSACPDIFQYKRVIALRPAQRRQHAVRGSVYRLIPRRTHEYRYCPQKHVRLSSHRSEVALFGQRAAQGSIFLRLPALRSVRVTCPANTFQSAAVPSCQCTSVL